MTQKKSSPTVICSVYLYNYFLSNPAYIIDTVYTFGVPLVSLL